MIKSRLNLMNVAIITSLAVIVIFTSCNDNPAGDKDTTGGKDIAVSSITISGDDKITIGEEKQYIANVLPANATNKGVNWSIVSGTGQCVSGTEILNGTIDGLLWATAGTSATIRATSVSNSSSVFGEILFRRRFTK